MVKYSVMESINYKRYMEMVSLYYYVFKYMILHSTRIKTYICNLKIINNG